jgi:hypothetical protein
MAYDTTVAKPVLVASAFGGGPALWIYNSTDIHTDVDASGYFTDGDALGMKVGDMVLVGKTSATIGATLHYVQTVTAGGAATVAAAILA